MQAKHTLARPILQIQLLPGPRPGLARTRITGVAPAPPTDATHAASYTAPTAISTWTDEEASVAGDPVSPLVPVHLRPFAVARVALFGRRYVRTLCSSVMHPTQSTPLHSTDGTDTYGNLPDLTTSRGT